MIFADADLEAAIHTAVAAFVFNTGQFCMAGSRLLVERPVYDDVLGALAAAAPHVPVGDPFDEATVVGPMAGPRHLAKVRSYVDAAPARAGHRSWAGPTARAPTASSPPPTVLAGVEQDSPLVQEEIFGPVLTVQPFDTEEEAVRLANGTAYGLAAGLQTTNVARAHRVAARAAGRDRLGQRLGAARPVDAVRRHRAVRATAARTGRRRSTSTCRPSPSSVALA